MIAVDSNILVYAHKRDSQWHAQASNVLTGLSEGSAHWAIPWQCLHEFMGVATHLRVFARPSTVPEACAQIAAWLESPSLVLLGETEKHWFNLHNVVTKANVVGPRIHDARIAAICLQHGVDELWTADRDFSRFPDLKTRNPLVAKTR